MVQRGPTYRNLQYDAGAGPEPAVPGYAAADRLGPLAHPGETEMRPSLGADGQEFRFEADTVVLDGQSEVGGRVYVYPDAMGTGVLSDVRERLSGDAEYLGLGGGRERRHHGSGRGVESNGQLRRLGKEGRVLLERSRHAAIGRHGSGEVQDGFSDVDVERPGRGSQLCQLTPRFRHATGREHLVHGLGLGADVGQNLGKPIVHFAGDALTLALDGQDLEFAAKADRLQRQTDLRRQRGQGLDLTGVESAAIRPATHCYANWAPR